MDRLTTAKGHTQNLLEEIAKWKIDLVYNDEQSIKTCVDCKFVYKPIYA